MKRLPLFSEKFKKKITKNICHSIAKQLYDYYSVLKEPGLLNGLAGISCFFFHFYIYSGEDRYKKAAYNCLEKVIQAINNGFNMPSFATGLAGIYWLFEYLGKKEFISREESSALSGLKPIFKSYAKESFRRGNYDFLHGALGMAMTGLGPEMIDLITNETGRTSKPESNNCVSWLSRDINGNSEINFGLAHGIPSIILILSAIYKKNKEDRIIKSHISPGIDYLITHMEPGPEADSLFPSRIKEDKTIRPSRMAWCYGDPGVAAAIYQTGTNCSRADWQNMAIEILKHAAKRKEFNSTGIEDACICHGSAGLAIVFFKAWSDTGRIEFYNASCYWLQRTLDFGGKDGEYLFKGIHGFEVRYGVLEGIAGVGLSLLAMLEGELPGWEKALLLC